MAQIKISELNSATNLNNNDVFPIVNGGDTKKATLSQLKSFVGDLGNYYTKDEVDGITGDLDELETTENSDLVSAINEINSKAQKSLVYLSYTTLSITQNDDSSTIISKLGGQSVLDDLLNAIANNNKFAICIGTDMTGQFGSLPITITSVRNNSTSERLIILEFIIRGMVQDTAMPQIGLVYNENNGTVTCIGVDAKYLAYKSDLNNYATQQYVNTAISNKIWIGTQTEYDNLSSYSDSTLYFIKEDTNAS